MAPRNGLLAAVRAAVLGAVILAGSIGSAGVASSALREDPTVPLEFAPVDEPGPDLALADDRLADGLICPEDLPRGSEVALLVHGTATTSEANWSWGYQPALEAAGVPVCLVDLFAFGLADAQVSAERVVFAVRSIHERTDAPVDLVGYSQGAQLARFVVRFWPDVRAMVDDVVLVAAPIPGTTSLEVLCADACAAAFWQFRNGSAFTSATNSGALVFDENDTTSVFTFFDAIVTPNERGQSSTLPGATNISVQDVCPANEADHFEMGTSDPVAFAVVLDALEHDGPADVDRLPPGLCDQALLPGLDAGTVETRMRELRDVTAEALREGRLVASEPPLRCFVTASCFGGAGSTTIADPEDDGGKPFVAGKVVGVLLLLLVVGIVVAGLLHLRRERQRSAWPGPPADRSSGG